MTLYTRAPEGSADGGDEVVVKAALYTAQVRAGSSSGSGIGALERLTLRLAIGLPFGWLFLFLLLPTLLLLVYSFWTFTSFGVQHDLTLDNYGALIAKTNLRVLANTLEISVAVTLIGLVLAYQVSLFINRFRGTTPYLLLLFMVLPFLTNGLLRVLAWKLILGRYGLVNDVVAALGLPRADWLLFSTTSLIVVLLYGIVPFMAIPIYASLARIDSQIVMAARDLGASSPQLHLRVLIPLAKPGLMMASLLGFITAFGTWIEPTQVGSVSNLMWGELIVSSTFDYGNVPGAAAFAFVAAALTLAVILVVLRFVNLDEFFGARPQAVRG